MQKKFVVVSLSTLVAACSHGGSTDSLIQPVGESAVAETVNGIAVPQVLVDAFARQRGLDMSKPEQRAQVLRLFADYVVLAQQAKHDGLLAKPTFAADVEVARLSALSNATIKEMQQQTPITDDALKAEYEANLARTGKFEYDFSQLLFANQDDALKAAGDALTRKPFEQVYDAWKDKAKQAKVFTRVHLEQLPEPMRNALADMKAGDSSKVPIQTQFGWHVFHLDATNPFTPPPFDQVKENLRRSLAMKAGQQRLDKLREQAKIEYPPGSTTPPSTVPTDAQKPVLAVPAPAPAAPAPAPAPEKKS